jgi:hypothetical protein
LPLKKLALLYLSDSIRTDATGRVRILFNDDSIVSLGGSSNLNLRDFADSATESRFSACACCKAWRALSPARLWRRIPKAFR